MAPPRPAAVGQAASDNPRAEDTKWGIGSVLRMIAIFWLVKSFFGGSSAPPKNAVRSDYYWPKFNRSEAVDFFLYASESPSFSDVSDTSKLLWAKKRIPLATNSESLLNYLYRPSQVPHVLAAALVPTTTTAFVSKRHKCGRRQCSKTEHSICMHMWQGLGNHWTAVIHSLTQTAWLSSSIVSTSSLAGITKALLIWRHAVPIASIWGFSR